MFQSFNFLRLQLKITIYFCLIFKYINCLNGSNVLTLVNIQDTVTLFYIICSKFVSNTFILKKWLYLFMKPPKIITALSGYKSLIHSQKPSPLSTKLYSIITVLKIEFLIKENYFVGENLNSYEQNKKFDYFLALLVRPRFLLVSQMPL